MLRVWCSLATAAKADFVAVDAFGGIVATAMGAVITVHIGISGSDCLLLRGAVC
jgi:hypothetical protein